HSCWKSSVRSGCIVSPNRYEDAMNQDLLIIASIALLACAACLLGSSLLRRARDMTHSERSLNRRIDTQDRSPTTTDAPPQYWLDRIANHASHWLDTPLGRQLVAPEDRHLLNQCGVNNVRGQTLFFLTRVILGIALP